MTNRAVADRTNLPSILSTIAARRHSIFGHIRRLSDGTSAHKAMKLVVNARSGDTPHHGWNRSAGRPRTSWISQIVRDTGLCCSRMDCRRRPVNMEGATTHSRLHTAVS